jgi:hypothetical protein
MVGARIIREGWGLVGKAVANRLKFVVLGAEVWGLSLAYGKFWALKSPGGEHPQGFLSIS